MTLARETITGIILCGGQARRMGGVDKPLQCLNGKPLVQHVRERLSAQVSALVISANRSHEQYAQWNDPVIADAEADLGPLGGLAAVLPYIATPWFFCCPGDAPFLDREIVGRLAATMGPALCAFPTDGRRAQPLFLLGQRTLAAALHAYLDAGERSVHGFLSAQRANVVDAADLADSFQNINSIEELTAASAAARPSAHLRAHDPLCGL